MFLRFPFLIAILGLSFAMIGCQPDEQIRSYSVPKEVTLEDAPSAEATHRMLAAVVPQGDQAWFFKVVGPIGDVDTAAEPIRELFESVRLKKGERPSWKLPDGWADEEGTGLRAATIRIPTKTEPLEISVMTLPWPAGGSALLENVNRWRGQLQLPPIGPVVLPEMVETIALDGATATLVDLKGAWNADADMPPFAGREMPNRAMPDDAIHSPPMAKADSPPATQANAPFQYQAPEGWQPLPASGFRKLAFQISGESGDALLTVTSFPQTAGPAITDVAANVNRWRSELRMPEASDVEVKDAAQDIEVDGEDATLVELFPDEASNLPEATLAAMIPRGENIWFIKLKGDRKSVEAERKNFREFVMSIDFKVAGGGTNGN